MEMFPRIFYAYSAVDPTDRVASTEPRGVLCVTLLGERRNRRLLLLKVKLGRGRSNACINEIGLVKDRGKEA